MMRRGLRRCARGARALGPHVLLSALLVACAAPKPRLGNGTVAPLSDKPRVVVTTDPELDDSNSLLRYLLYSTDFRTEGLVYASSQFHWKGDGTGKRLSVPNREYTRFGLSICPCESWRWAPGERFIDDAVDVYERVYPNLRVHHPDYPTASELRSKIRSGNVEFDGDFSKDTPGSDLIRDILLDDDPAPVYLLAWGGASTIARALKSIQDRHERTADWPAVRSKVSRKAILSLSGDQDDTYATYIKPNWPDVGGVHAEPRWHRPGGPRHTTAVASPELRARRPERLRGTHAMVGDPEIRRRQPRAEGDNRRAPPDHRAAW